MGQILLSDNNDDPYDKDVDDMNIIQNIYAWSLADVINMILSNTNLHKYMHCGIT